MIRSPQIEAKRSGDDLFEESFIDLDLGKIPFHRRSDINSQF